MIFVICVCKETSELTDLVELQFTCAVNTAGRGFKEIPIADCTWVNNKALPANASILSYSIISNHIGRDGAAGNTLLVANVARTNGLVSSVYVIYDYKSASSVADFTLMIAYRLP